MTSGSGPAAESSTPAVVVTRKRGIGSPGAAADARARASPNNIAVAVAVAVTCAYAAPRQWDPLDRNVSWGGGGYDAGPTEVGVGAELTQYIRLGTNLAT